VQGLILLSLLCPIHGPRNNSFWFVFVCRLVCKSFTIFNKVHDPLVDLNRFLSLRFEICNVNFELLCDALPPAFELLIVFWIVWVAWSLMYVYEHLLDPPWHGVDYSLFCVLNFFWQEGCLTLWNSFDVLNFKPKYHTYLSCCSEFEAVSILPSSLLGRKERHIIVTSETWYLVSAAADFHGDYDSYPAPPGIAESCSCGMTWKTDANNVVNPNRHTFIASLELAYHRSAKLNNHCDFFVVGRLRF